MYKACKFSQLLWHSSISALPGKGLKDISLCLCEQHVACELQVDRPTIRHTLNSISTYPQHYTTFTPMQEEGFSLNLVLKYVRSAEFAYEALNQTVPIWIALNQVMWKQTKACITNLSWVNKRENRVRLRLTDIIFGTLCPPLNFLKKHILESS
jgi:hypothetical protein